MYPTLVVYLNCSPEKALERVKKRNRNCETNIPIEYLTNLKAELDEFIEDFQKYTFVKEINANIDLDEEGIKHEAIEIYNDLQILRLKPIISRMGV
jgi:deoxyadenosine/deoxycytidine kinase